MRALRGLFDNDDTLRPFYSYALTEYNRKYKTSHVFTDLRYHHLDEVLGTTRDETVAFFQYFLESATFKRLRPYDSAPPAIKALRDAGDTQSILSALSPKHQARTEQYASRHFGNCFKFIDMLNFTGNTAERKADRAEELRGDYLVEDRADTAIAVAARGIHVFVPVKPWNLSLVNTEHPRITLVKPWWHPSEGPRAAQDTYVPRGLPDLVSAVNELRLPPPKGL